MVSREDSKEILISKTNDLRNRLEGILESKFEKSDAFLLRWLVAGSYDVNRTEKALRESKAWKLNCWELQTLGVQDLEHLSSTFHLSANYIDKEGRTTLYLGVGKWPLKSYLSLSGGKEKFVKYVVQFVGRVSDLCQEKYSLTNGAVHQATIICDFGGFSLKQITSSSVLSIATKIVSVLETHFPGIVHKIFIINVTSIAKVLFTAVRPFLSADTTERLKIFDSNRKKWETALSEVIDLKQLNI